MFNRKRSNSSTLRLVSGTVLSIGLYMSGSGSAIAASATCQCYVYLGQVRYNLPGIDPTLEANLSFSGVTPQDKQSNQGMCRQRCSDISPQFSVPVANEVCKLTPDRTGVVVTMRATLGVRELGERYPFGTFKSVITQPMQCPAGWISNSTNTPGLTVDGLCKQETGLTFGPPPSIQNGTPVGNPADAMFGFFWNNTLVLRGNNANGGSAIPLGAPNKTCGWQ